ncbi:MAG: YraN family protein [Brevinematia bacterium]
MKLLELYQKHEMIISRFIKKYKVSLVQLREILENRSKNIKFSWFIQEKFSLEKSIENWFSFSPSMMKYILENRYIGKFNLGKEVEIKGCEFLSSLGFEILVLNYSTKEGEIDIICCRENEVRFVEVKSSFSKISPEEKIDVRKTNRIITVSEDFIDEIGCFDFGYDALFFNGREFRYCRDFLMV